MRLSTGRVCACGGKKSLQARICQSCRTVEKRSPFAYVDLRCGAARVYGTSAPAHKRREELARARAAIIDPELADLVEQQRKDDTLRAGARWLVSLDGVDCFGRSLYDVIPMEVIA